MTNDSGDPEVKRGVEAVLHARRLVRKGESVIPLAVLQGHTLDGTLEAHDVEHALPQVQGNLASEARAEWEAAAPPREPAPTDIEDGELRLEYLGRPTEAGFGGLGSAPGGLRLGNYVDEEEGEDDGDEDAQGVPCCVEEMYAPPRAPGGDGHAADGRVTVELCVHPGPESGGRVGVRVEASGVEVFELDPGFDYDNVRLSHKATVDASGRAVVG